MCECELRSGGQKLGCELAKQLRIHFFAIKIHSGASRKPQLLSYAEAAKLRLGLLMGL